MQHVHQKRAKAAFMGNNQRRVIKKKQNEFPYKSNQSHCIEHVYREILINLSNLVIPCLLYPIGFQKIDDGDDPVLKTLLHIYV